MNRHLNLAATVVFSAALVGLTGCTHVDTVGRKMAQAATRLAEPGQLEFEGEVRDVQHVGSMTAISFTNGVLYDVQFSHIRIVPGDIVRIYRTSKGLEAALWKEM